MASLLYGTLLHIGSIAVGPIAVDNTAVYCTRLWIGCIAIGYTAIGCITLGYTASLYICASRALWCPKVLPKPVTIPLWSSHNYFYTRQPCFD